ncbi:MAG: hypothetical protein B5M52_06550 [Helicobacteraceae bacterium 4484_230]|nr:MAG: hypothetical protein B5M52_06550 [Helicobacteraceae bacterium 4484_230]
MKKRLLAALMLASPLFANMASLLIMPTDATVVAGVYVGSSTVLSRVKVESTNANLDGRIDDIDDTALFGGGYLGLQNKHYRFSVSYDIDGNDNLELQRLLINFDYRIGVQGGFRPMAGFGVGASTSRYSMDARKIKQDKGAIAVRGGVEYFIDSHSSLEFLAEYTYMLDSGGDSFYSDDEFTDYDITSQHSIMFRVGYSFTF